MTPNNEEQDTSDQHDNMTSESNVNNGEEDVEVSSNYSNADAYSHHIHLKIAPPSHKSKSNFMQAHFIQPPQIKTSLLFII